MGAPLIQKRLKEVVSYDAETGKFYRLNSGRGFRAGPVDPKPNNRGYLRMNIDGRLQTLHRLAMLYEFNEWPLIIDHIDGVKTNNAIANLRACSRSENAQNLRSPARAKSGLRGAYWREKEQVWRASICVGRKQISLGVYATAELAHAAYLDGKKKHHKF